MSESNLFINALTSPDRQYGEVPFYWWNGGELNKERLTEQLEKLAEKGLVKSFYGGVAISEYKNAPVPVYLRDKENSSNKEKIAMNAARFVKDNTTIIFDSSSTVRRMCKYILDRKGLTVVTSNLRVCDELKESDIKVICTGGTIIKKRECFAGHLAEDTLRKIKADMLFFSSQGISDNGDITDSSEEETSLRKVMFSVSREHYFLCDPSKKNKNYPFVLCNVEETDKAIYE
jgi:DeoR/GlpR family transcriptional regulator of sugar metabolism